jgi:hypothetical protein
MPIYDVCVLAHDFIVSSAAECQKGSPPDPNGASRARACAVCLLCPVARTSATDTSKDPAAEAAVSGVPARPFVVNLPFLSSSREERTNLVLLHAFVFSSVTIYE